MSPARRRTSIEAIVAAARAVLETDGLDGVTMAAVAARVGVQPPSLYKHLRDRTALVASVAEASAADLEAALLAADPAGAPPGDRLRAVLTAYRAHAARWPRSTALLCDVASPSSAPAGALGAAMRPLVGIGGALAGAPDALAAARLATAFVVGFTTLEQSGVFRSETDVDAAFDFGVETLVRGLERD